MKSPRTAVSLSTELWLAVELCEMESQLEPGAETKEFVGFVRDMYVCLTQSGITLSRAEWAALLETTRSLTFKQFTPNATCSRGVREISF